jgi:predicted DsbA family dithiol-disulfide isomerase
MKIEIWSDIMCPFCYMGKKQLEKALEKLPSGNEVEILWRSFELNPDIKYIPGKSVTQYLSEIKNMSIEEVNRMQHKLVEQGKELGIDFNFDQAPISNSHNAHKLIHVAQKQGKANQLKEALFHAYFTEGTNVEDTNTLLRLAQKVELDLQPWNNDPFNSETLEEEVKQDIYNAHQVGARGVPFFVFNEAYSLSGAHGADTLYKVIETARIKTSQ